MTAEGPAPAQRPRRRRLLLLVFAAVATLLALAVWRAWESRRAPGDGEAPLLRAEPGPARERPEDPGGMEVPYREVLALHELGVPRDEDGGIVVERLLPPPEIPLPRPETAAPDASDASEADDAPEEADDAPPAAAEEDADSTGAAPQEAAPAPPEEPAPSGEETADAPPVRDPPPAETAAPADAPAPLDEEDPIAALLARDGGFALQLGAFRTETDVEAGWRRALDRAPDLLGPLDRFIVRSDGFHRLRVGPFPDRPGAAQLCEALRRVDVACFVVAL